MSRTCGNCAHGGKALDANQLPCNRLPPVTVMLTPEVAALLQCDPGQRTQFPIVLKDWVCGEHSEKGWRRLWAW